MGIILCLLCGMLLAGCAADTPTEAPNQQTDGQETEDSTMPTHPDREFTSKPTKPERRSYIFKTVGKRSLRLTFHPPTNQVYEKAPVILIIPGGGYTMLNNHWISTVQATQFKELYANGFATAIIEYRLDSDGVLITDLISDCMDAARFLAYYSDVLQIDTDHIITWGHSAGGALSLLMGYADHDLFDTDHYWPEADFHVSGVFAQSPNTISYAADGPFNGYYSGSAQSMDRLYGTEENRRLASAITHVKEGGVPCVIMMGTHDPVCAPENIPLFEAACAKVGVDCRVIWLQNADHGYLSVNGKPVTPTVDEAQSQIVAFAKQCVEGK